MAFISRWAIACKVLIVVLPVAVWNGVCMLPRVWIQRHSLKSSLFNGVVRAIMTHLSPQQLQAVRPSTVDTYKAWIRRVGKKRGYQERVQATDDSRANILWLEKDSKYDKVVLFFHGGGYVLPISNGHFEWMAHLQEHLASQDIQAGIAILEYSLIPAHPYPAQMSQAIDALQSLINSGFKMENVSHPQYHSKPSRRQELSTTDQIIIGGDSAGGHLTLSLLSHLLHPRDLHSHHAAAHPATPSITGLEKQNRLAAAFLVSPLCSLDVHVSSYKTRCSVDMLSDNIVRNYGKYLIDGTCATQELDRGHGWSFALDMSDEGRRAWWNDLDTVVKRVLVTVGQEEIFRDHCIEFANVLRGAERKGNGLEVELVLEQDEAHDAPLFDFELGRPVGASTKAVEQFVGDAFKR